MENYSCLFTRWRTFGSVSSKMVTTMLRHSDQEERQTDGSRHWDSIKPLLMRAFAHEGAPDFSDKNWLRPIHEGSIKKRLEYCTDDDGNLCCFPAIQGHSGGIPTSPELMKCTFIPYTWKEYICHRGSSWIFLSIFGSGIIPGGKEKDRARQAVPPTPLNPFGKDPEEEEKSHFDYKVRQKVLYETRWKQNQDAVYGVRLSAAHDQGLQLWQTKSCAIMAYATIRGDRIDFVTAQNGDRLIFERLATPRNAPKVTLKRNWRSQQQQPISFTDVTRLWKQRTTWESQAEVQDDSKNITETDQAPGNRMQSISKMDVDTHLGDKEVSTDAFSNNEANNQVIERVKIGSNKIGTSRRSGEGEDGVYRRVQPSYFLKWVMWSSLSC